MTNTNKNTLCNFILSGFALLVLSTLTFATPIVRQGSAANASGLQAIVDLFRADLGGPNNGVGNSYETGRREINWDGVPNNFAEPNNFPFNFFNVNSPRGVIFNSVEDATGAALNQFAVSANTTSGVPVRFGNLNPTYSSIFQTFSSQRLFIARNTHIVEVTFFIPGTNIPAGVNGFGVVFTDVDSATGGNRSLIRVYGEDGAQLSAASAPVHDNGLSFVGISFNAGERITRVVIESGNAALSSTHNDDVDGVDVVAMDDFIYGEPQAVALGSSISGVVVYGTTPSDQPAKFVPGVSMVASGASFALISSKSGGAYQFNGNLKTGGEYTITPSKTTDKNGITSFDATLVLRCVAAGDACALTNNQRIAADTDNNGISSFDATQILRYVAANGSNANTGQVGNWKFDPASRPYPALNSDLSGENYTAFLIGEINGDWMPPSSLAEYLEIEQTEQAITLVNAEDLTVVISTPETIGVNKNQLELTDEVNKLEETAIAEEQSSLTQPEIQLSLLENVCSIKGSIITVPVYLTNITNKKISAYSFAMKFDPDILQPESAAVETSGTLSQNGFVIVSDTNQRGRIGIAASALNNSVLTSGTLLYLRFRVVGAAKEVSSAAIALGFETTKKGSNSGIFEDGFGNRIPSAMTNNSFFVIAKSKD